MKLQPFFKFINFICKEANDIVHQLSFSAALYKQKYLLFHFFFNEYFVYIWREKWKFWKAKLYQDSVLWCGMHEAKSKMRILRLGLILLLLINASLQQFALKTIELSLFRIVNNANCKIYVICIPTILMQISLL